MRSRRLGLAVAVSTAVVAGAAWLILSRIRGTHQTRAGYVKHEYRIVMRDGVTLFTQVYLPKNRNKQTKAYPILIQRTPFGVSPYGEDQYRSRLGPSPEFDRAGYIFVFQDVRGRFQSQGEFVDMRPPLDRSESPAPSPTATTPTDESTDMVDTVEWLLKNVPSNNGKVGIWGMSYPGFYAAASIIESHPAIRAASPQAPMTNLFLGDDAYHNGVFMLAAQFQVYANFFKPRDSEVPSSKIGRFFDYGTSNGYQFFLTHGPAAQTVAALVRNPLLDENIRHDTFDEYWKARDLSQRLHQVQCAVLTVGGWFDAEDLAGTFRTYHAVSQANPGTTSLLVMGPWGHGDWLRTSGRTLGPLNFGSDTGAFFRSQVQFPFFEHYLRDAPAPDLPGALAFETGTNQWRRYPSWPPPGTQAKSLYLHANGKLTFDPPTAQESSFDEYVSDPAKPVPYVERPPTELASNYMYGDQRFAGRRPDVLTYTTDPLEQDLTVAGPIAVRLQVSTSGTDSDFVVKLIDEGHEDDKDDKDDKNDKRDGNSTQPPTPVYRHQFQQLVRGEPMRARFRNSFSNPEAMQPNQITSLTYTMPDINHTFLRGHRIVIQVQSSWFPLADLNPQSFVQVSTATPADFVKATQRVFHKPDAASSLLLEVLTT